MLLKKERDGEPISLPDLGKDVSRHSSRFWRDALRLRPEQVGKVSAIGPVVNKFTFQDATSVTLPSASAAGKNWAKISADCDGELRGLLKQVTPNRDLQHPEINAAVELLTPNAEAQIRGRLSRPIASTADIETDDKAFLREVYAPVVEQVVASVTPGSPLRRRDAKNHAQALLDKQIRKLVEKPAQPANAGTPAVVPVKTKRGRKRGGQA
jgi:hypothetical protein